LPPKTPRTSFGDAAGIAKSVETSLRLPQDRLRRPAAVPRLLVRRRGRRQHPADRPADLRALRNEGKVRFLAFTAEGPNGPAERLIKSGRFDALLICFQPDLPAPRRLPQRRAPVPERRCRWRASRRWASRRCATLTSAIFQRWVAEVAPECAAQVDWSGALIAYNLSHPQVDVAVVGMRSEEEVDHNVEVVESGATGST